MSTPTHGQEADKTLHHHLVKQPVAKTQASADTSHNNTSMGCRRSSGGGGGRYDQAGHTYVRVVDRDAANM